MEADLRGDNVRLKYAALFMLLISLFTGCAETEAKVQMLTLSLSEDTNGHYEIQTDGNYIYLADMNKDTKEQIRKLNESIKEVLRLPEPQKKEWHYLSGRGIPDPAFFSQSVHSPATYSLTAEDAADFLLAMTEAGWKQVSTQGNYLYLDIYFNKEDRYTRVIILGNKMKVFEDVSGSYQDSWTYISKQLKQQ